MNSQLPDWCLNAKTQLIKKGMTIKELAEGVGISRVHASRILNGRIHPWQTIERISYFLGIPACHEDEARDP